MISGAKMAFWGISAVGVTCLATVTAIYWKNITENPFLKSLFNSIYEVTHMGELLEQIEGEAAPLDKNMPDYKFLSSSNPNTQGENLGFGKKYGNVLVATENNNDWWKWSAKKIKDVKTLTGDFSSLKNKGENDFAELKNTCSNAYKKKDEDLKNGERKNTWFLCSPFGTQPYSNIDIPKARYRGKFGSSKGETSSYLLSDRPLNKNVWEEIHKKLVKDDSSKDTEFSKVKSGYSKTYDESNPSLNKICDRMYAKTQEEITSSKENIWKYCSLSGKEPQIPKQTKS